jgi:trimethylamine--corrinoid protein Co-methyltransferase
MKDTFSVKPRISILNQEHVDMIHSLSLQILDSAGIRIDSDQVLQLLENKIGKGSIDGKQVRFPREIINWAIDVAPDAIDIYQRDGEHAFTLGEDQTRFGAGVTTLYYMDPSSNDLISFQRRHMQEGVRLGNCCKNLDVLSTLGVLHDYAPQFADLYATLEMISNTTKPMVILISASDSFPWVLDMVEQLHGDLYAKPFILPYLNPITPLLINQHTTDKMQVAIQRQLPIIYSSYGMLGASTPITLLETIALLNAEALAGLTIAQVIREATPVILGPMPAFFDMKTMVSYYDPLSMLLNLVFAEMMEHYRIPHCGTSGSTTGWLPDIVSSGEMMMNQITSLTGKVGLAPFVGSLLDGKVFSPVNMVHADEIIANARRFAAGFSQDPDHIALEEIFKAGPGGSFLSTERTLDLFRTMIREDEVFPRLGLEKWQESGSPKYGDLLKERTLDLLKSMKPPNDHDDLLVRGEEYIKQHSSDLRP